MAAQVAPCQVARFQLNPIATIGTKADANNPHPNMPNTAIRSPCFRAHSANTVAAMARRKVATEISETGRRPPRTTGR